MLHLNFNFTLLNDLNNGTKFFGKVNADNEELFLLIKKWI